MVKKIFLALWIMHLSVGSAYAHPENSIRDIVVDALYGGLAGTLIGSATLAFENHPSNHTENIKVGAGVGIILGSIYGTMQLSRSLVEVQNGVLTVQMPTLQIHPTVSKERWSLTVPLIHLTN